MEILNTRKEFKMTITYWLRKLREAFLKNDYDGQSKIAKRLLPYEESGSITNDMVMELFK